MPFPIGVTTVIVFTVLLNIFLTKNKKKKIDYNKLAKKELEANSARRKDISPECFIEPNLLILPFSKYENSECAQVRDALSYVKELSIYPMIKFDKHLNNNEIKLMFGVANLEDVAIFEENYTDFLNGMIRWAEKLIKIEEFIDAETILKETIRMKSDFSKSYTLLADIYGNKKDIKSLESLLKHVSNENFMADDSRLKEKISKYIQGKAEVQ